MNRRSRRWLGALGWLARSAHRNPRLVRHWVRRWLPRLARLEELRAENSGTGISDNRRHHGLYGDGE